MIKTCIREPLVHFLVFGAIIFVCYELVTDTADMSNDSEIVVDETMIQTLSQAWLRQHGSEPDAATLKQMIADRVTEEVLFREALKLGLDENDTIIRRRLIQKMEFLSANLSQLQQAKEQMLKQYFAKNKTKYTAAEKRSFTHIYFSKEIRGEHLLEDAESGLHAIRKADREVNVKNYGDGFILQNRYQDINQQQLARLFGEQFSQQLFSLAPGNWQGPISSEYGLHLIYLHNVIDAAVPEFEQIKSQVVNDFMNAQLIEIRRMMYQKMRENYRIVIATPSADQMSDHAK